MKLRPYCTRPCSIYGKKVYYDVCRLCDFSDCILLDVFMRREEEKEFDIKQHEELAHLIENNINRTMIDYCKKDVEETIKLYNRLHMEENNMNYTGFYKMGGRTAPGYLVIEKVIFNEPATIVMWNDHTKTVVQMSGR